MRNGLIAFAAAHGAGQRAQADIALAVSEGLTNAVVHAFTTQPPGKMSLFARAERDVLHVTVIDDGSGMRPRRDSPGLGVGLTVIMSLTSAFEMRRGPDGRGTEVRLTFDAPGLRDTAV
jgi:anti-sigma regulatory factor (Ser/Thr protein kinase)